MKIIIELDYGKCGQSSVAAEILVIWWIKDRQLGNWKSSSKWVRTISFPCMKQEEVKVRRSMWVGNKTRKWMEMGLIIFMIMMRVEPCEIGLIMNTCWDFIRNEPWRPGGSTEVHSNIPTPSIWQSSILYFSCTTIFLFLSDAKL